MRHLLSLEALSAAEMRAILDRVAAFKRHRATHARPLAGQTWALIFSKSSTRTRVSFEVGLRELGAEVLFLNANDIQLGRGEPIKDTARVLGRMIHGAVIRTFAQSDVEDFAAHAKIPTVNALTDDEHPCQILTDIFTYEDLRGEPITGRTVFVSPTLAACSQTSGPCGRGRDAIPNRSPRRSGSSLPRAARRASRNGARGRNAWVAIR